MKKLILLLVLCCNLAVARPFNQPDANIQQASSKENFLSVHETGQIIRTILDTLNWKANFIIQEKAGLNNAYATMLNGRRYIIYDNRLLNMLNQISGTQWAAISVIAHEIGHHYYNHLLKSKGSTPEQELQADYFSGYVMAKLGATANEATIAIRKVSPVYATGSHPGGPDRVNSIESGWNYAMSLRNDNVRPNRVPQSRQNPSLAKAESTDWIHMYSQAENPMTVYLSDDGRTYNTALVKTSQPFVFKFEIYNYGYLRFSNERNAPTYKLIQGRDYSIVWDRRSNNWTVSQIS